MSGDIYFGIDKTQADRSGLNDGYVNSQTFMAFGDILEGALAGDYPVLLDLIKEREPLAIYYFVDLSASDYNTMIHAMRTYIASLKDPTDWQKKGIWVWQEMAEPFIRKDDRYDYVFHHEVPPMR